MDLYMMNCELLATCSALGYLEGETYHAEPDCLESVKDLIRYLRHEDDTRDIRQQLGAGQILQNDLLPLITQHAENKPLFDACIRLMVNLTQPALLCFGKVPEDPVFRHHFLQVECFLQAYKEAFASEKVFAVFSETLYKLLQLDWEERQEEDNLLIERILLLVRNVLHVPANPYEEKNVDDDASVHDKLLWAVHMSGFDDLIKFVASAQSEQQWSMHVLEIISLMFRDQKPENLVSAGHSRSAEEKHRDGRELEALRQKELAEKRSRLLQRGNRHSRFGGSYVVQGLKSIGDNDVIYHRGLHNFKNYTHDSGKSVRRVPKRNRQAADGESKRRSALNVRLFLREFCVDFLENCYNHLMYLVKENLIRETAQQHDETYYLWALSFFMAFNRGQGFRADLVSETVSIRCFHYMERNITNYYEMMLTDKKEATSWSKRMHLALKAYQELLLTVNEMDRSQDPTIRQSSNVIKSNIFYLMEYREIFLTLLRKFDERKQPRSFLKDLVESTHLFLRMLERFCKGRSNLVVQKKKVKRRRSNKKKSSSEPPTPEALEETWKTVADELRATGFQLSDGLVESIVPFDPTSETPLEEQRTEAMVRLQDALLARLGPEALGLLRAAREVWPEGDVFGSSDVEPEEELELLKQILFANLPRSAPPPEPEADEDDDGAELLEEEMETVQVLETDFNFLDFIKRFAAPNIVQPYLLLLKSYSQNSPHTNHCIARMLHRLAVDLKMEALMFQLSVFHLFNKILSDPAADAYKELVTFSKFVLKRFFALAATNNKAFVELLFWKNVGAVREMTEGYAKDGEGEGSKASWTPEEEEELQRLYDEHRDDDVPDIVETLIPLLSNSQRTRRQVVVQMVTMGLVSSAKELKKQKGKGTCIVLWTEDQEEELQILYEEFRDSNDVLGNIMKKLTAKRSRPRVVEKLLSLGLVSDRKELYKKRSSAAQGKKSSGKSSGRGMSEEEFLSGLTQEDEEEEEEEEEDDADSEESDGGGGGEELRHVEERGTAPGGDAGRRRGLTSSSAGRRSTDVEAMVRDLQDQGKSGPLLWLQNCLNRTADSREEDGISQPVALVPFTEDNENAMENKPFQKLLKKLGVRPPANEQESFWRISAKMSPSQLRGAAASLSPAEEGVPQGEEPGEEAPGEDGSPSSPSIPPEPHGEQVDSHEQRTQALRALLLARKRKHNTDATDVNPVDEPQEHTAKKISNKRTKKRLLDNEEDDHDVNPVDEPQVHTAKKKISNKRSKKRVLDNEENDHDATDVNPVDEPQVHTGSAKKKISNKRSKKRVLDDEEDDHDTTDVNPVDEPQVHTAKKKISNKRSKKRVLDNEEDDHDATDVNPVDEPQVHTGSAKKKISNKRSKKRVLDDEEDDHDVNPVEEPQVHTVPGSAKKKISHKRSKKRVLDDEEDNHAVNPVEEPPVHTVPEKISNKRSKKRVLEDEEDDHDDDASPALVMDLSNDGMDSDSDKETLSAPPKRRRKMALIDDDDDD